MLLHKTIFESAQRMRLVSQRLRMEGSPNAKGFDMAYMLIIKFFKKSQDLNLFLRITELEREVKYHQSKNHGLNRSIFKLTEEIELLNQQITSLKLKNNDESE